VTPAPVTLAMLFFGFLRVALSGFGGVMPWARRMMVDERRWMSEAEFVDLLALCQLLPGPNIVNVAIAVGARFHGLTGALVAFAGLMIGPTALVIALGLLYLQLGHLAPLRRAFSGIAAVAAGMVIAMALRIAVVLRGRPFAVVVAVLAFVAAGILRWPLGWIVLALAPLSILVAARTRA
jgi:chromate transporter